MKKNIYMMLFGACLASCSSEEVISLETGDAFSKDGIGYAVLGNSQKNQTVEAVSCGGGDVVIPSTVEYGGKTYQVESVDLQADQPVTSLTLSEGIRSLERIADGAEGSNIRKLVLPGSMMYVGEYGTTDEPGQFHLNVDCLEVIDVADGNPMYGCGDRKNVLIYKPSQSLIMGNSNAYIPKGVRKICGGAFCWSEQYNKPVAIDIPEGVDTIEYEAFKAPIITSIRIPSSVTSVLEGAFNGDHLQSLVIEDSSEQLHFHSRYGMYARCIVPYSYMVDTSLNLDEVYVGRNTLLFVLNAFGCLLDADEKPDTLLGFEFASSLRVERIDTIETRGLKFRRFTLTFLDHFKYPLIDKQFENEQGILYDTDNVIWVEGIGSNVGPFFPWFPLQPQHAFVMTCSVDKTFIFGSSDFYMSSMQENYRPLVEQGKKWTYHHDTFENVYDYYYILEGDTVIAGKNCLKMYSENKDNQGEIRYEGALYEEDRKVYRFHQEIDVPEVLYDFDCQVGDTLPFQGAYLVIQAIESVEILGMSRKRYDFQAYVKVEDSDEIIVLGDGSWLEGIGSMKDFYNMIPFDGNYNSLMACEMNGVMIYQSPTAIQSVRSYKPNTNGAIYDLQGRRLKAKPSHRVYIQNGKKRIMR